MQLKKYRIQEQCFVVEGEKGVQELLHSDFTVTSVVGTSSFINSHQKLLNGNFEVVEATESELAAIGSFQTNASVLAVANMRENKAPEILSTAWTLVLDDIRDPGNLGTIIRTADWYGLKNIIASTETADCYNPKVISASMGSFTRVSVFYTNLAAYLAKRNNQIYGTFLNGTDLHNKKINGGGFIVIGNEANGISSPVEKLVTHRITIPRFGLAESLNAAIATAVVLDNIMRSQK